MGKAVTKTSLHQLLSDSTDKKRHAIHKIIKSLFYNQSLSNLELSRITDFSGPTVSALLDNMIHHSIVEVRGQGTSNGGRKPTHYGLNKELGYVMAVFMDQYYTRIAILNIQGNRVLEVKVVPLKLSNDTSLPPQLFRAMKDLIAETGIEKKNILGIGIGMPGILDSKKGFNYTFFNFAEQGIQQMISAELGLPVFIENDSNVLALGEHRFGFAMGKHNVLVVNASWGVGLGMILNGELYHGHAGFAGEFSHIPINSNGLLCSCGKQGCLETEASAITLARLAKEGIRDGNLTSLSKMLDEDIEKLEAELVIEAANLGDQYSVQILSQVGYNLGKGIAVLIHLMNPELIVVSGRLAKANHYIMTPIEHALNKYSIPRLRHSTNVVISELSEQVALLGCASLVIENLFQPNREAMLSIQNN